MNYIEPIARLVGQLARLPGVGQKSAARLAFHILDLQEEDAGQIAEAIVHAKATVHPCERCGNWAEAALCDICMTPSRDAALLCVVEDARDVAAMERMREYHGLYHVLGGTISPMDDRGPDDIRIPELLARLSGGEVKEVILATNTDIEGEATASYITHLLAGKGVRVSRIAHGVPVGGNLEYADEATLSRALAGRRNVDE